MKKQDLWGGLIWFLLGLGLCAGSSSAGFGSFRAPGTGFLPFLIGMLMALFGAILAGSSLYKRRDHDPQGAQDALRLGSLIFPSAALIVLLAFVVLLEPLGFLLTTFLCLLVLFKLTYPKQWLIPLVFSGTAVGVSYLVFVLWLRNPFPTGIFGF